MEEVLTDIDIPETCWEACTLKPGCAYYVYYELEFTCNLYLKNADDKYYTCDIVRGPSGQDYDDLVSLHLKIVKNSLQLIIFL